MHEALTIGVEGIDSFKNKAFSPFQLPGPLSRTNSPFLSAGGVLGRGLPSPTPPARIPAGPTPPPGCVCKQGSVSRGCWRGPWDWRAGGGRRGRPSRRRTGPGYVGASGSLFPPSLSTEVPSSGHRADPGQLLALSGLGHHARRVFKCRHFAWWQTNFFVTPPRPRPDPSLL